MWRIPCIVCLGIGVLVTFLGPLSRKAPSRYCEQSNADVLRQGTQNESFDAEIAWRVPVSAEAPNISVVDQAQPQGTAPPKKGDLITNSLEMKLVYVPAGEYLMGSPANEGGAEMTSGSTTRRLAMAST